jgi:hypothetical protein
VKDIQGVSHKRLNKAALSLLRVISNYIGTNTFCISQTNDERLSIITHVFNRNTVLFNTGDSLYLEEAY